MALNFEAVFMFPAADKKREDRKRTAKKMIRKIIFFFTVLAWLMSFILTAVQLAFIPPQD